MMGESWDKGGGKGSYGSGQPAGVSPAARAAVILAAAAGVTHSRQRVG